MTNPEKQSLFRDIAQWIPAEKRETYWEMVAHLDRLSPDDEVLRVCQAMGVLAVVTRQVPGELLAQRDAWLAAYSTVADRLQSVSKESRQSASLIAGDMAAISIKVKETGERVAQSAERVEKALVLGVDRFSSEELARRVKNSLESELLRPAEQVVQKTAQAFLQLEQRAPRLEAILARLEEFSLRVAYGVAGSISLLLACLAVVGIWVNLDGWYRTSLKDEVQQMNARLATSQASLRWLNEAGKDITVYTRDGMYVLVLPKASEAYISTEGNGVILFKKK